MRILVVDDSEMMRRVTSDSLIEAGYEVEMAENGEAAWNRISKGDIRMVVSDWVMPKLNGLELCRQIRNSDLPGYVYIILLTSLASTENIVTGLDAGADDFITKPFNPEELKVRVRAGERIISLETRNVAIFAMAKLAESRDPETGIHLERIRVLCKLLSERLSINSKYSSQITRDFIRNIYLTSPLHDVGKVGVPDCVLLKPGRLNSEEFELMKEHAKIGGNTLKAAAEQYPGVSYLHMGFEIAYFHHERYDGTGYPFKLSGENIPICARIVSLADVYDALISKRVYKEAFTHLMARSIIVEGRGKHFDPVIVDAFLECEKDFHHACHRMETE